MSGAFPKVRQLVSIATTAAVAVCGCTRLPAAKPGWIQGRVLLSGVAAAGAEVSVLHSGIRVKADHSGAFSIGPIPSAKYVLTALYDSASGTSCAAVTGIAFDSVKGLELGDVALTRSVPLEGVALLNGQPLANATLQATRDGVPLPEVPVVVTDAGGNYAFPYVPEGNLLVKAMFSPGSQVEVAFTSNIAVTEERHGDTDLQFSSERPAMSGTLSGTAIATQSLSAVSLLLSTAGRSDLTEKDHPPGTFTIADVPPGIYAFAATSNGYSPEIVPDVLVDGPVDLGSVVLSQADVKAVADCNTATPTPCAVGQPGCDPDETPSAPAASEINAACSCQPGVFLRDDGSCVDECMTAGATCDANATCIGSTGTYLCTCNSGYVGDGKTCTAIPPQINELNVSPQIIGDTTGGTITASFQANEFVPLARVAVTVGDRPMRCTETGSRPWNYVCSYSIVGDEISGDTEQLQQVTATLSDTHGDTSSENGYVDFDFRLPKLVSLTITYPDGATSVAPGGEFSVDIASDRPLAATTRLSASGVTFSDTISTSDAPDALFAASVSEDMANGTYGLTVVLVDDLGNVNTLMPSTPVIDVQSD